LAAILTILVTGALHAWHSGYWFLRVAAGALLAVALLALRLGGQMSRSLLPLLSSVLGTHTRPPSWLGTKAGEWIVFLWGPFLERVDTVSFKLKPGLVKNVIDESRDNAAEQIAFLEENGKTILCANLEAFQQEFERLSQSGKNSL